ncbi:MAG TPA: hypothetical protein VNZ57_02705 [Longimicrobiales bacterium]|nr:hypothetical protein [Longimicrobiales bacterium]
MLSVLLVLSLAQPALDTRSTWPGPLLHVHGNDGPEVIAYLQPELDLVAVRLSIPLEEYPGAVSGAVAHQQLVSDRLSAVVARLGGRVELSRRPTHVVYMVVGPGRELPGLVSALREALLLPSASPDEVTAAWLRAERIALAGLEIPAARIRHELWSRFQATNDAGDALVAVRGPDELEAFWQRHYLPDRMRVIVVGGTDERTVISAFSSWNSPGRRAGSVPTRSASLEPAPQLMAPWVGVGFDGRSIPPAALAVAARVLDEALRAADVREAAAELWLHRDGAAVVVLGAGRPGSSGTATVRRLTESLLEIVESVAEAPDDIAIDRARKALRRDLVLATRTPQGLAEVLGDFADRTGDPGFAAAVMSQIDRLSQTEVRTALRALANRRPLVVEMSP